MSNAEVVKKEFAGCKGKKILGIRQMTPTELDLYGWDDWDPAIIILVEGGRALVVSQDAEGNAPGMLFLEETEVVA